MSEVPNMDRKSPVTFKPSQVTPCDRVKPSPASSWLPFVGNFGKCEIECAAAMMVRTCAARGDEWAPVSLKAAQEVLKEDVEADRKPWSEWMGNPFVRFDVWALVARGYASWADQEGGSLVFTDKGFEVLARFVPDVCSHDLPRSGFCPECSIEGIEGIEAARGRDGYG